jgi:hypothetical protein
MVALRDKIWKIEDGFKFLMVDSLNQNVIIGAKHNQIQHGIWQANAPLLADKGPLGRHIHVKIHPRNLACFTPPFESSHSDTTHKPNIEN